MEKICHGQIPALARKSRGRRRCRRILVEAPVPAMQRPPATEIEESFGAAFDPDILPRLAKLPLQHLSRPGDLDRIRFSDGLATVSVDATLLPRIRFKNARRNDLARVADLRRRIATHGYIPTTPVICRIGQKGKWIVVDGGHRLTALRQLYRDSLRYRLARRAWRLARRLPVLARPVRWLFGVPDRVYCILFLGPRSNRHRPGAPTLPAG
jgi:hypothetical protein